MPAQPHWLSRLPAVYDELTRLPRPLLERADVESLLGVGRRRAQQILESCATGQVGASSVTTPAALAAHLRRLAAGEAVACERRRRHQVAEVLAELRRQWIEHPRVPVEAPSSIVNQEFADLPDGVDLTPGKITVSFRNAQEGLEKLLALAMAIGNDVEGFERRTALPNL